MSDTDLTPAARKSGDSLPSYRAYMVRCWQEYSSAPDDEPIWRFSLEASWYNDRRGFASLQALMNHLQSELMSQETGLAEG